MKEDNTMRKTLALCALLATTVTTAQAADLAPGVTLDTEIKAWHKVDAETNHITINPEVNWTPNSGPLTLSVGTVITAYDSSLAGDSFILFDTLDDGSRPNIDFGADYAISGNTTAFAETSWDIDNSDRTELSVGVKITF